MHKTQQVDYPLMFFFVAFIIIILGLFSKLSFQKGPETNRETKQVTTTSQQKDINAKIKSLNYNNPIQCNFSSVNSTISAQLEGANIAVVMQKKSEVKKMVLAGDCMYTWMEKEIVGQKQCGMGQYVTVGKQLLGSGLASVDSLGALAKQMGKSLPFDMGAILESCTNVKEVKKEVFVVPKNIEFAVAKK